MDRDEHRRTLGHPDDLLRARRQRQSREADPCELDGCSDA